MSSHNPKPTGHLRLAVLLSGGGTTMQNLARAIRDDNLTATIELVISSRANAYGVKRAKHLGLNTRIVKRPEPYDPRIFSRDIFTLVNNHQIDLVCLAGFLTQLDIPSSYSNRVINIHPALLPNFGGKGMYGHHVHEAVLKAGCKFSGCTVHFCNQEYDQGAIIVQRKCPVERDDTPQTLAARVFEQERIAYPEAIRLIAEKQA